MLVLFQVFSLLGQRLFEFLQVQVPALGKVLVCRWVEFLRMERLNEALRRLAGLGVS